MILFDLQCGAGGEIFEAWFRSSADYEEQSAAGLVECPVCGSTDVSKAPMAPRVRRKGYDRSVAQIAAMQAEVLKGSRWVGEDFAETARAMYCGEADPAPVHGQATIAEAKALVEEGVPVAPLPLSVVPPSQLN